MSGRTVSVHLAHLPGSCGLALPSTGNFALTSGPDAIIRPHDIKDTPEAWWRTEKPIEPDLDQLSISDMHDKPVNALVVSCNNSTLATASDDGFVRVFSLINKEDKVNAELVQACARFAGPVRALDFSPTGSFLAAAGDEPGVVKLIVTAQPSNVNILRAPEGSPAVQPTVCLAYDPRSDYIVAITEKGQSVVWDVEKCTPINNVELNNRTANCVAWSPDGDTLVYGTDKGLVLVARQTWMFDCLLEDSSDRDDDDHLFASAKKDNISAVAWSPNGLYLLAGREDCTVSLWDVHQKKVLVGWKTDEAPQNIKWHPTSNAFVLMDSIGNWGLIPDAVPPHMPSPHADAKTIELPALPETGKSKSKSKGKREDDDEEDGVVRRSKNSKKLHKKRKQSKASSANSAKSKLKKNEPEEEVADQELENNFAVNLSDVEADDEEDLRRDGDGDSDGSSGDDSESDEELDGELAHLENGGVRLPKRKRKNRKHRNGAIQIARSPAAIAQDPFMPSSTPLSEKINRKKHILVWNLAGVVISYSEQTHDVIEIEFAEASKRTVGIKDHFGYSMGCLSETGVCLASKKKKEHASLVTFRPFSSWASGADWTQILGQDEDISAIALGQRFAAVATSPNNVVRLFSLSGLQTSVFGVPGNVITAAANGERLVIVYVEANSAVLKCELLEISTAGDVEKVMYSGPLMMCADSKLEWIGFTNDTGELCSYDSNGWLWVMTDPKNTRRWVPMLQNAAKSAECDWFWAASVTSQALIGVPCLSNERYPQAKPRPALRSVVLRAPVIEQVTKSGKPTIIERLARTKYNLQKAVTAKTEAEEMYDTDDDEVADAEDHVSRMELATDKCLLSLMEDACKREQNMRALDLTTRLHCKISFKYAVELAKHYRRTALAERVEQVALQKMELLRDNENRQSSKQTDGSPITPQVQASQRAQQEESMEVEQREIETRSRAAPRRRLPRMFESPSRKAGVEVTTAPKEEKMTVMDVTDDEEEDGDDTEPEMKAESPVKEEKQEEEIVKPKKRKAPMPASQASVKGAPAASQTEAKKPRITDLKKEAAKGAALKNSSKRGFFRNRFLKK